MVWLLVRMLHVFAWMHITHTILERRWCMIRNLKCSCGATRAKMYQIIQYRKANFYPIYHFIYKRHHAVIRGAMNPSIPSLRTVWFLSFKIFTLIQHRMGGFPANLCMVKVKQNLKSWGSSYNQNGCVCLDFQHDSRLLHWRISW